MAVLRDRAGKKYRERYHACCKQSHEYHMGTGLRNDSYQRCQNDHQSGIVAYPSVYLNILQRKTKHQQYTECPCKDDRKMPLYYVLPHMLFNEMVRSKQQHDQHYDAESCKQYVHPVFAQKVDSMLVMLVNMTSMDVGVMNMVMFMTAMRRMVIFHMSRMVMIGMD